MRLSLAFISPVLVEAAMDGRLPRGFSIKRLTDLPMLWSEQWRAIGLRAAGSGSSRTRLIHPNPFRAPRILLVVLGSQPPLRPLHLVVRETEFCGQRLAGDFRRRTRENGQNSVRRPRHAALSDRNCEGFCVPGNCTAPRK